MKPDTVYQLLLDHVDQDLLIDHCILGLTWTVCHTQKSIGFAQSPGLASRTLEFPGTVAGSKARDIAAWIRSWNPHQATIGLAAINATINTANNWLIQEATRLTDQAIGNLAVFDYLRPRLLHQKIVIIGRYPGLESLLEGLDVTVLERQPGQNDLPDPAAEYLLPEADWVFITATSLINKTFPRLARLSRHAVTVLIGPSTPWLAELARFDIDFLAGVIPVDARRATQIAAEGGGTRLFGEGVCYGLIDIGQDSLTQLKQKIADCAQQRQQLQLKMENWYAAGYSQRFPEHHKLETLTNKLSQLDTHFKRQWDARN
ncbi:Rossmann-like domain-containing protein [Gynuella sp.]|uniref:Rossmann-like domain-containing protein n=1 Tax=Gynuella sp. TaxID=2969146 RepID=UPI003D0E95BE